MPIKCIDYRQSAKFADKIAIILTELAEFSLFILYTSLLGISILTILFGGDECNLI